MILEILNFLKRDTDYEISIPHWVGKYSWLSADHVNFKKKIVGMELAQLKHKLDCY